MTLCWFVGLNVLDLVVLLVVVGLMGLGVSLVVGTTRREWMSIMARRAEVRSISGGIVVMYVVSMLGILVLVVMIVRSVPVAIETNVLFVSSIYGH